MNKKDFSSWSEKFESSGSDFIYILFSCLFYSKSKTLTHLRESLIFYKNAFGRFITNQENQKILLKSLFEIWGNSFTYLKFLVEFLTNQNIIDHKNFVDFIFEKIKENFLDKENLNIFGNYFFFDLIEILVNHSENSLNRIQKELTKEQESLNICDETMQNGIIKSIEFLEEKIEKNLLDNQTIHKNTLDSFLKLLKFLKENDAEGKYKAEIDFIGKQCVKFVLKNNRKLKKDLPVEDLKSAFDVNDKVIKEILGYLIN